ncbi:MAG: DUF72 domain-containing protein [Thermoprotei archaeon]|nr:MAG: DUF72 domain-containing protein [Thermoprotei archaeon]
MEVYVGTSGWSYSWNPDGFAWYSTRSGLNAVELNMSFYSFPRLRMIYSWAKKTRGNIRWAIKVNRIITHVYRLSEKSYAIWHKFQRLFKPLEDYIDFYLFQMPPSFRPSQNNLEKIEKMFYEVNLGEKFALEIRDPAWISEEYLKAFKKLGLTFVSVDAPEFKWFVETNGIVYLRVHGRTSWYSHRYTADELVELADEVLKLNPRKVYVFFNNNHDMLDNGREMLEILKRKTNIRP